jgi:hypothetical protein
LQLALPCGQALQGTGHGIQGALEAIQAVEQWLRIRLPLRFELADPAAGAPPRDAEADGTDTEDLRGHEQRAEQKARQIHSLIYAWFLATIPEPAPPDQDRRQEDKGRLLNQLAEEIAGWITKRGPRKAKSVLRERRKELHTKRVRRERVETGMGCQRQGKYEGNPSPSRSPLGITEEQGGGHERTCEREGERVCDGPMSEQRATG